MANMMDYLDWRGDLTFTASGFNEVDNLLFAELVYTSFDGIVTGQSEAEAVTLAEASAVFWEQNSREEILARVSMTKAAPFVLEKMAKTERFRDVKLWGYVNDISEEEQSQFAVMCAGLPDGSIYVSFRGTDNTITGWREDFNMGYLSETPGQLKAVSYVEQMLGDGSCPVRIGGHSKGGNLAVYAAVHCSSGLQDRILAVYSNDGPGFRRDIVESAAYQRVLPKIHTILPESSIVGMLLEHQEAYEVVRSSNSGIQQHDAMSWEVLGTSFVYVREVAAQSLMLDETMKAVLRHTAKLYRCFVLMGNKNCRLVSLQLLPCVIRKPKAQKILKLQEKHYFLFQMIHTTGPGMFPGGRILYFWANTQRKVCRNMKNIFPKSQMMI